MATIEKRKGHWRVKVRKSSASFSKTFNKKSDAVRWAIESERLLDHRFSFSDNQNIRLGNILERYAREVIPLKKGEIKELSKMNLILRHQIADIALANLTRMDIARYRDNRLQQVASGTVRRELSIISHALNVAVKEWGYALRTNPVTKIRKPVLGKTRSRRLEGGEEECLLRCCSGSKNFWLLPLVVFAIETAMRRGELLSLEWEHVHTGQGYVHLPHTKNGEPRDVPLSGKAREILNDLPTDMSGLVFPLHFEALKGLWKRATQRAGIEDLHFHDLRHEATSRFFEKGLNIMEVSAITGHKDLRMLKRYTHLKAQDLPIKLG